jgi:hypothetical protein
LYCCRFSKNRLILLPYFPTPYQDELLYSVIARYGVHCGITSAKELLRDLFNQSDVAAVIDFPGHLKTLKECLGGACSLSIDDWTQHHTLYPAFLAFIPGDRQTQIIQSAHGNNAGNIHTRLGICASFIKPPKYLRLCKECQREQHERLGETYWQRNLQLPGVMFCPHHELPLVISSTPYHPMGKFDFQAAEHTRIITSLASAALQNNRKPLIVLSQNLHQILQANNNKKMSFEKLTQFYSELGEKHVFKKKTRVDHSQVAKKFHAYWKEPCSRLLLPDIQNSDSSWLTHFFRKHRKSFHPLCHLMVWQAFCINDPISTLSQICNFLPTIKSPRVSSEYLPATDQIKAHRKAWTLACKKNPNVGVKYLRYKAHADATYTWLYRNDSEWLRKNSPKRTKVALLSKRVDWKKRDKLLLKNLQILHSKTPTGSSTARKSKAWYIKNSSEPSILDKHLDKLPLCKNFIDSHYESIEEFQRRRIIAAIRGLLLEHHELKAWKVIRRAGIRKEFLSDDLLKFIDEQKGKLGYGSCQPNFSPYS